MARTTRGRRIPRRSGTPKDGSALEAALRHLEQGRPRRAAQILAKLLKSTPNDPSILHFLGVAHYRCGRFAEAIGCLEGATKAAPNYAEAANSLGTLLLETRRVTEARGHFERTIALRPDYANAHTNLGDALRAGGDPDAARASYERALALDPESVAARYKLAAALVTLDRAADALAACAACLAVDPFCQNALATKAIALEMSGRAEEARALYDFERLVHPAHPEPPAEFAPAANYGAALAAAIRREPSLTWEPLNRVTRNGAVTQDILAKPVRLIRGFENSLRREIDAYRDSLAPDPAQPFLARIPRRYRLTLIASILKAGGWHPPHIHESAWLSGVFYVQLPDSMTDAPDGTQGCLEFGRPDYALPARFEPRCIRRRPAPGLALFFPSYFYHGTIAFDGDGERIGIAFDAYPAD